MIQKYINTIRTGKIFKNIFHSIILSLCDSSMVSDGEKLALILYPPVPNIFVFSFYYYQTKNQLSNMLKIKCDINQQDLKIIDIQFVKYE